MNHPILDAKLKPLSREEKKQRIVQGVIDKQGCKAVELLTVENLITFLEEVIELTDELIQEDQLIEIKYVLPTMNYRCKSFLFPAGTDIKIKIEE